MADYNDTVALSVKPPDPNQQFSTINNILGIQAKRQALEGQAAEVQQAKQDAAQRQAAAQFFQNFDPTQHIGNDGTLDLNTAMRDPALNATGDAKPKIIQALLGIKKSQLDNSNSLAQLNQQTVQNFGQTMNSLRNDEDVVNDTPTGRAKVASAIDSFGKQSPDNQRIAQIYAPVVQHAPPGKLASGVNAIGLQAQSVSEQQSQQNPRPGMVDTGAEIQPTVTQPQTGSVSPIGQPFKKTIAPQIVTAPNSQIAVASNGNIKPLNDTSGGVNLTGAQATAQRGQAEAVTGRVSKALEQANNTVQAQDALSRAKAILESPESPNTGPGFDRMKSLKSAMSTLGIDTQGANDMNTLAKNLARFEAARATASGLGGTDAARELAHNGSPNTSLDNKALLGIVRQSLATEKVLSGYAKIQSGTNDPQQLIKNETAFRSIPHPIETMEYTMSRNKEEAERYLQEHGLTHKDIASSAAALKQFGVM